MNDGRFTLNALSQLVDGAGNPVLSANGQPIRIDPTKTAPSIAHDGTAPGTFKTPMNADMNNAMNLHSHPRSSAAD